MRERGHAIPADPQEYGQCGRHSDNLLLLDSVRQTGKYDSPIVSTYRPFFEFDAEADPLISSACSPLEAAAETA